MRKYMLICLLSFVLALTIFAFRMPVEATTKLTVFVGSWYEAQAPYIAEKFHKENPDMEVEFLLTPWDGYLESATLSAMKSKAPDVIDLSSSLTLSMYTRGLLEPLDEMIATGNLSAEDFFPGLWELGKFNGVQYGIPNRSSSWAFYYNPILFAEAGLDPNRPPETSLEFLDYAKKLTYGNKYGYGMIAGVKSIDQTIKDLAFFLWGQGGDFLNADQTKAEINSPESKAAVKFWTDLYLEYHVVPEGAISSNWDDIAHMFGAGVIAMAHGPDSGPDYFDVTKSEGFEYRVAVPPEKVTNATTWNFTIPKNAPDKKASWKFIEWFTSPDVLPEVAVRMPSVQSAIGHPKWSEGRWPIFLESSKYSRAFPNIEEWPEISRIICEKIQEILVGNSSVEDAMDKAASDINELLK